MSKVWLAVSWAGPGCCSGRPWGRGRCRKPWGSWCRPQPRTSTPSWWCRTERRWSQDVKLHFIHLPARVHTRQVLQECHRRSWQRLEMYVFQSWSILYLWYVGFVIFIDIRFPLLANLGFSNDIIIFLADKVFWYCNFYCSQVWWNTAWMNCIEKRTL